MKINFKKLPFTKNSFLLVCFFSCMFIFASFTKEDRQKVREFKNELINNFKKDIGADSRNNNPEERSSQNSIIRKSNSFLQKHFLKSKNRVRPETQPEALSISDKPSAHVISYPSKEKEGIIGVFSDKEKDRISDNFFTVNIPFFNKKDKNAYLEYDLFGLASHHSVSRSLNHNVAIGGEVIVANAQWSHQKEKLDAELLKHGLNTILFTSPSAGVKYKIKNLRIVFEKNTKSENINLTSLLSGDKLYIKGSTVKSENLFINNEVIPIYNGEFERIIQLTENDKQKESFSVTSNGITNIYKLSADTKSFAVLNNNYFNSRKIDIANEQDFNIKYEDLNVKIEKETSESASIEVLKLREKDIPAISGGLKNITLNNSGYRFSLRSGRLNKKIKITIPYDEKKLGLISPKEISVFSFDYTKKQWKIVESKEIDQKNKTVTFESDGEGDYINGVISLPESPQLNSFVPTTISGLKAANPVGAPLMQHPTASQTGDANINYPLILPAGVSGMQPSLSVTYSSGNGNGWMGEGWNIAGLSSISVDTKWGTPTFTSGQETELYSIDGEMLIYPDGYLPHRHNKVNPDGTFDTSRQTRNGSGSKTFYLRRNHDFTKIERFGNSPSDYRWVITSTDGTKTYYGGDQSTLVPNAVLKNYDGNIIQWGIWKTEDVHGNNIIYEYKNQSVNNFTGDDQNLNAGWIFHIDKIFYSGRNGQKGPYSITFFNDTPRPDKQINTKGILKRIEPYLLTKINIEFKNVSNQQLMVRSYNFSYDTGIFQKSLLSNMKMKVNNPLTDGAAFDYNFEYYDNGTVFGAPINIQTPNTDAFSDVVSSITTPSKISADNNFEWGWSLRTGAGLALLRPQLGGVKNFMISLFGGASYPRIKRGQELVDFNGDGIADILYRKRNGDNGIKLIPGSLDSNGQLVFNSAFQSVGNLNSNFSHSKGTTWNLGGSVAFNWFKMGFEFSYINSESENETPIYMMDANSDGLPDVIKDDKVWFNRRSGNSQEMVITSDLTENMVITANSPQPYTEPEEPDDIDPVKPKNDVVKVWIAPKNGFIEISDEIAIASGQDNNAKAVYSIEIKNPNDVSKHCRLYLKELINTASQSISIRQYNSYPGTPLGVANSNRIYVKSGEKVYFRLHKKSGINYIVNTNPVVTYTDINGNILRDEFIEEQDGYMPNQTNYDEKFFLNNLTKSFKFTEAANIRITIPQFTIPALSDNVKYSIVLIKEDTSVAQNQQTTVNVIYEETVGPSSGQPVVVSPVDINYSVPPLNAPDEAWHLKFLVETDSHINKEIEWNDIVVEGYPNASYKHYAVAQYPSYHIRNLKNKFDISTLNNLPSGYDEYSISINKNFNFIPSVSGKFMYVIKQKGIFLDKRIVEISNGALKEYTIDYNPINGDNPIPFYNGDPTANIIDDQEKLNILIFCDTNKDRLAYEALKLQLNNNIFNIYNQAGSSILNYTTETSINTGEYNGVSAIYHNWGQFLYNEARDIVPAAGSTNQQPPLIPGCVPRKENDCIAVPTGPSGSTGPAYTINPNTPKDQYGVLINDQTLENPFQFNVNFSACAGITNSQQYAECIGDQLANDFQNNYANNQIFGAASPFTPLNPYKADRGRVFKWVNQMFYEQYSAMGSFRDDETPTSPFIDDDPDSDDIEVANNPNTRMFAISKKQRSKSKTKNAGIGFGLTFTNSSSQLRDIGNIQTQDFFDVNGDNYPDMLYRGQSQQTSILGGLKSAQSGIEGGYKVITRMDDFMNSRIIAFNSPGGSKPVGRQTNNTDSNATGDTSPPYSLNAGTSNYPNSYNKTTEYWMDINGDGLPDKIEGNTFKLNFGTGLVNGSIPGSTGSYAGFEEPVSKPVYSASFGIGAGISSIVSAVQGVEMGIAVSGGVGGGSSTATSKRSFLDVNGDGLVDIVQVNENTGQTNVKYNLGNRFTSPVSLNASLSEETKTHSGYANLNGGYYINIPFIVIFGIPLVYLKPFGADLSANVGLSVSEINKGLRDVNGDGLPDLVVNTNSGLKIFYSQLGKTNKLKKVSYAESYSADTPKNIGAAFIINYGFSKPSYNDPQSKLVMSEVIIPNPDAFSGTYTLSTTGKDMITRFEYENSRYDRREREKYGFAKVKTYEMSDNNTVYRTTVQNFYNQNYFIRGLLKSVESYGGTGTSNLLSSTTNNYKLYQFNPGISQLIEVPAAQFESYDVGGTEGRRMGRVLMSGTTKTTYENGNSISTKTELFYNNRGQLTKYQYTSPSTSYNSVIAYHTNLNNNIQNVPSMITVYPGTGAANPLRKRSTEITNLNTGDISKFKVWLTSGDIAETDITYDPFGNIKTIKYPPNEFDQRSELEYFYDPMGKYVTQVKDPVFNLSSYATYNPLMDTVLEYTDVTGNKMKYNYDGYGRPLSIISPNDWPSINTILYEYSHTPVTLSNGNILYLFNAKTRHQDPYNNNDIETISFADVTGDVIQVKKDIEIDNEEKMSVSGRVINDNLGRAVMQYHPVFEDKNAVINNKLTFNIGQYNTSSVYDYKDRTVSSIDEAGNSVDNKFFIESNRFRTETTQMQNASVEIKTEVFANAEGKTVETRNYLPWQSLNTLFNYNEIGEIMIVTDPEGLQTSFTYDMGGRRLSQDHPDRGRTTCTYSKAGQLTHIRNNNLNSNGGVPIHYVYSYNRLMNIVLPDIPSGPNPANVTYTYGTSGNNTGRVVEKQDGTGTSYYKYGKMGELTHEDRFIYGFYMPALLFNTSYQYDNWNRIRTITYPDNEVVHYQYDLGGNLKYMANEEGYEYIKSIQYDHYEQRTKIVFGNDTSSTFTYEPDMRRLQNHLLYDANSNPLLNGTYSYDYAGNITGIANTSPTTNAGFGGNYNFEYQYDTLNRLTSSSGNAVPNRKEDLPPSAVSGSITSLYQTDLTYNMSSGIERKRQYHEQDGIVNTNNTYNNEYIYMGGSHMLGKVSNNSTGITELFRYDGNGNVTDYETSQTGPTHFYWDEQDRLRAVYTKETGSFQYYVYDDKGERTIKANLQNGSELYQNGEMIDNGLVFDGFKVYPNPYAVYSSDGMLTKHYFAGDQRIASRLSDSGGMFYSKPAASQSGKEGDDAQAAAETDFKNYLAKAGYTTSDIEKEFGKAPAPMGGLYYLHGDHLGTATYVTNEYAEPTQFFLNLPFGETMVEQQEPTAYVNPYKFNAKELDSETGLYYYGARYYNPRLSIWYGVDPLAVYNPVMETQFYGDGQHNGGVYNFGNLNPYIYCYQNPVIYIDPNGKQTKGSQEGGTFADWVQTHVREPAANWINIHITQPTTQATQPLRDAFAWTPERTAAYNNFLEKTGVQYEKEALNKTMQGLGDDGLILGSGLGTGQVGAFRKTWRTTTDNNFVGKLATRLGRAVKAVDQSFTFAGGSGDVDIVTSAYNIEVKSGNKMKLSQSLKNSEYAKSVGKKYLLYMPKATNKQIFDASKKGINVIKSEKELGKLIK